MNSTSDRYELLDVIASGGMATVWRARDTKLNRLVALKRPHPAPKGSDQHKRFETEGEIAATVTHSNLVTVFDAGTDDEGPFLVMELIDASTLASGTVELQDLPVLGAQVASALAALHAAGIVHRDVKPANILLAENGAKLTDFGIARSPVVEGGLTQAGAVMATPEYAAPEILAGAVPTPASDVYSLGAVLRYRLGETEATDALISRAMAPDPANRPTAADLSQQLKALAPLAPGIMSGATQALELAPVSPDATAEMPIVLQQELLAGTNRTPPVDPTDETNRRSRLLPIGLTLAFLLAAFAIAAAMMSNDDPVTDDAALVATTTTAPVAESSQAEVAATTVPADPADTSTSPLEEDVKEVVALIEDTPRNVLKKKEADGIIDRVVEGVASAVSGSTKKAEEEFRDAVKKINDKLDSDQIAEQARSLIRSLGIRLGLNPDEIVETDSGS